ncbi:MAG: 4Fe-4S binding protein [Erysipelotrichaceae bacterium]|jgi:pyruvate ferredoxin oxidoreductase delta subunit|nr:4Fe-4S binding protein [Erysipelotrichaceae bacterium]
MKAAEIKETLTWKELTVAGEIAEGGTSVLTKTGEWRTMIPRFIPDKCKQCMLCVPCCPDMSIPVKDGKRLDFDYDHCKGCGICYKVCPFGAIEFEKEEK